MGTYLGQPVSLARPMSLSGAAGRPQRAILRWSLILPMLGLLMFWFVLLHARGH